MQGIKRNTKKSPPIRAGQWRPETIRLQSVAEVKTGRVRKAIRVGMNNKNGGISCAHIMMHTVSVANCMTRIKRITKYERIVLPWILDGVRITKRIDGRR